MSSNIRTRILDFLIFILIVIPWNSFQEQHTKSINNINIAVEDLAKLAEELNLAQKSVSKSAALKTREKFAKVSSDWANLAKKFTLWKTKEVIELTRRAQEAQITSLKFGSIASRLKSAVMSAQEVFDSAFDRYKSLSALARAAENHSSVTSKALVLLQYVQSVREKWATEERARAFRLSQHLQNILYDLKKATEFAETAQNYADMSQRYVHPPSYLGK